MYVQCVLVIHSDCMFVEPAEKSAVWTAEFSLARLDHVVELAVEPPEPVKLLHFVDAYVVVVSSVIDVDWRLVALCFPVLVEQLHSWLADSP